MANDEMILDWDSEIEDSERPEWSPLEEGDYTFKVINLEKTVTGPKSKHPGTPMAVLTLEASNAERTVKVTDRLVLHKSAEWRLADFFTSIGLRKRGEKLKMMWGKVEGATGMAHFTVREYVGNDGKTYKTNDVSSYLEPAPINLPEGFEMVDESEMPF